MFLYLSRLELIPTGSVVRRGSFVLLVSTSVRCCTLHMCVRLRAPVLCHSAIQLSVAASRLQTPASLTFALSTEKRVSLGQVFSCRQSQSLLLSTSL